MKIVFQVVCTANFATTTAGVHGSRGLVAVCSADPDAQLTWHHTYPRPDVSPCGLSAMVVLKGNLALQQVLSVQIRGIPKWSCMYLCKTELDLQKLSVFILQVHL